MPGTTQPYMLVKSESESHSVMSDYLQPPIQSMEFSRPEHVCVAFPFSRIFPNPGIKPRSPALQMDSLPAEPNGKPRISGRGNEREIAQACLTLWDPYSLWTVACQAPLSMEFSRPEYWSGYPIPSPGDLTDPGIQLGSPALQTDSLPAEFYHLILKTIQQKRTTTTTTTTKTWEFL